MIGRIGFLVGASLVALTGTAAWPAGDPPLVVDVTPGTSVEAAVEALPEGALIRLLPGAHPPFSVTNRVTIAGGPGTLVQGPVRVGADGARLAGLRIVGGRNGITIDGADDVLLEGITIRGARLHGVEISAGSATVRACDIAGMTSPYAQGVEVRNSTGHPHTVVEGCRVSSGQEGLVSHVARVEFIRNHVAGTSMRGIAVTEMSEGLVEGNLVEGAVGIAYYCGDMSHCDLRDNAARDVRPDPSGIRSRAGYGAIAWYHSRMRLTGNDLASATTEPVGLFGGSTLTQASPLSVWPPGWVGALPALWVSGLSLLGLMVVRSAVAPLARLRRGGRAMTRSAGVVLVGGLVVQGFHMVEHVVQVVQTYVWESEARSGLAGRHVDTEWVHFLYNTAVLAFLGWAWAVLRSTRGPEAARAAPWLFAALTIQAYHFVEHAAKIAQHLTLGLDPAPGIAGGAVGLVWFHFGINLAVFGGSVIAASAAIGSTARAPVIRLRGRQVAPQPPPISS